MRVPRAVRAALPYLAGLITAIGIVNFAWYLGESLQFGGSALSGFVRDGHFYLAQHGSYTEVSQAVWEHIRMHEISVLLSVPLVIVCTWYWLIGHFFPAQMGFRQGEVVAGRVHAVQSSGVRLAARTCGGNISGVGLSRPLFAVTVYPDGLTIRLFPRQPTAIRREEITGIDVSARRSGRVRIIHTSPDIDSPIVLHISPSSDLTWALKTIAARINHSGKAVSVDSQ
ncbi:MAG: hypothetical protein ACM3N4_07815 [Nitrososphaerota archaeon]